jgi:uncharacterized damage-inducible protein DinB
MTWRAPAVTRIDEPFVGDERAMLAGFLQWGRSTLLVKCSGLTGDQLACQPIAGCDLSLLALVRHLAGVERWWFRRRFAGEDVTPIYPDAFADIRPENAAADYERLVEEWSAVDASIGHLSLDHGYLGERWGAMTLRWCLLHMISEYDRHNGHADLIRQSIDGQTGS